jgi:NADH-quinone oxidoreductase subunit E
MFRLSPEGEEFVKMELKRYEDRKSAIIPALYRVQKENGGWVSNESVAYLSQIMDLPEVYIEEVLSFYTMFNRKPVGRYHVQVCTNVSCAMNGGRELLDHLCEEFKTAKNTVSADGKFTFTNVECLGSCGTAPMMQVNADFHENLTEKSAAELLRKMK